MAGRFYDHNDKESHFCRKNYSYDKSIFLQPGFFCNIYYKCSAQVDKNSDLFIELKKQDSIFFERGFNQCDLDYLESRIAEDLKFYHDQSGFQDKNSFFENTQKYICSDSEKKPIRKVDTNSLEVFPLYNNGKHTVQFKKEFIISI